MDKKEKVEKQPEKENEKVDYFKAGVIVAVVILIIYLGIQHNKVTDLKAETDALQEKTDALYKANANYDNRYESKSMCGNPALCLLPEVLKDISTSANKTINQEECINSVNNCLIELKQKE